MNDKQIELKFSYKNLFKIKNNQKLGVMRVDWYDGSLANTWNSTDLLKKLRNKSQIDLKKLQDELNYIQFIRLENFNKVIKYCKGIGFEKETILYAEGENQKYVIKLIPVKDSYSYIYVYNKYKCRR